MTDHWEAFAITNVQRNAATLEDARAKEFLCVVEGDAGGQTYFTVPSKQILCTGSELARLAFEVDFVNWYDPSNVHLFFGYHERGERFGGGMGGALSTGSLWIHDTMHGSMFAKRIEDVLRAKIPSTWPSSSAPDGKPLDPFDVLDLLDEEPGNAPIFGTIRRAVALRSEIRSATYSDRLSALLRKVLSAAEPRNRIEAAQNLLGEVVDPALLVQAVYGPASGDAEFPRSGSWRRQAVHMLGSLAKAGNRQAYDALKTFSASDEWIRSFGPYVFDKDVRSDADRQYGDPKIFRREFARFIWGNSTSV